MGVRMTGYRREIGTGMKQDIRPSRRASAPGLRQRQDLRDLDRASEDEYSMVGRPPASRTRRSVWQLKALTFDDDSGYREEGSTSLLHDQPHGSNSSKKKKRKQNKGFLSQHESDTLTPGLVNERSGSFSSLMAEDPWNSQLVSDLALDKQNCLISLTSPSRVWRIADEDQRLYQFMSSDLCTPRLLTNMLHCSSCSFPKHDCNLCLNNGTNYCPQNHVPCTNSSYRSFKLHDLGMKDVKIFHTDNVQGYYIERKWIPTESIAGEVTSVLMGYTENSNCFDLESPPPDVTVTTEVPSTESKNMNSVDLVVSNGSSSDDNDNVFKSQPDNKEYVTRILSNAACSISESNNEMCNNYVSRESKTDPEKESSLIQKTPKMEVDGKGEPKPVQQKSLLKVPDEDDAIDTHHGKRSDDLGSNIKRRNSAGEIRKVRRRRKSVSRRLSTPMLETTSNEKVGPSKERKPDPIEFLLPKPEEDKIRQSLNTRQVIGDRVYVMCFVIGLLIGCVLALALKVLFKLFVVLLVFILQFFND